MSSTSVALQRVLTASPEKGFKAFSNPEDCGNSPRQTFLKEFNTAFAKGNVVFIIDHVSEDIGWWIYGDKKIGRKKCLCQGSLLHEGICCG